MKRVLMPIGILLGSIVVAVVLIRNPTRVSESAPEIIPISVRVAEVQDVNALDLLIGNRKRWREVCDNFWTPASGVLMLISAGRA